jgi:hypothetical protein
MDPRYEVLDDAAGLAHRYLESLGSRPVGARATLEELRARLARPLTDGGEDPRVVVEQLASSRVWSPRPARASSASSSAARCRSPSRPTG